MIVYTWGMDDLGIVLRDSAWYNILFLTALHLLMYEVF